MQILYVALGGGAGAGAVFRYLISLIPIKSDYPFLTMGTNLLGAILIGIIVGLSGDRGVLNDNQTLFLKVGLCGGFTTFSLESLTLLENGKYLLFASYVILSVTLCIVGVWLGKKLDGA